MDSALHEFKMWKETIDETIQDIIDNDPEHNIKDFKDIRYDLIREVEMNMKIERMKKRLQEGTAADNEKKFLYNLQP